MCTRLPGRQLRRRGCRSPCPGTGFWITSAGSGRSTTGPTTGDPSTTQVIAPLLRLVVVSDRISYDRVPARILLAVHSARIGGAQLMALAAAERLAQRYELHIMVPKGPLRERFADYGTILRSSPTMTFGWGTVKRWLGQAARSQLDAVRIAAYIRRHGIRAVYVTSTVLVGPVIGAKVAGVPVVVHARELPPDRRARIVFATQATLADTVITVSDAVDRGFGPNRQARFVRIYDGIQIPPSPAPTNGFHTPVRLLLIGTVGGDGRKGQDIAVAALAELVGAGVLARLELVGPIPDELSGHAVRDHAQTLGVGDSVVLAGPTDRIAEFITDTDILLSCARDEPLGLTLMEALVLGRPVVASAVGGIPEIVRNGDTGILVPPEDPAAVAEAVRALLADPGAAREMARKGRSDVALRFDRNRGLDALQNELERQLG